MIQNTKMAADRLKGVKVCLVVLLSWPAELHHNCSLTLPPPREKGRKCNEKGARVEMRTGRSLKSYCHGQNRLSVGRLEKCITYYKQARAVRNNQPNNKN